MIIDLILDRQDGASYNPKTFYDNVMEYGATWPEIAYPIADALDSGSEKDVKRELARYIVKNDYNREIIKYIEANKWL